MFGFTRSEQRVILFLTAAFFCGALIRAVREDARPLPDTAEPGIQVPPGAPETPRDNAGGGERPAAGVNLNSAGSAELVSVPGIGPVMAGRILAYRRESGRFRSVDELIRVRGIGPRTLEKIRPYLRID
ncbi:MAG: helix-hairpin-helix domain-containing protein [bacterium]|nr:helix-hairpin-helix domain-containing protein [bacterium]